MGNGHRWTYVGSNWKKPVSTPECELAMHDIWECELCHEQAWVEEWSDDWGLVGPWGSWVPYSGPRTSPPDPSHGESCEARVTKAIMEA